MPRPRPPGNRSGRSNPAFDSHWATCARGWVRPARSEPSRILGIGKGVAVETAVKEFQQGAGLTIDGIVGPLTCAALPDGGRMPTLQLGSAGPVVTSLQTLLTNGAPGQWVRLRKGSTETSGRIRW